MNYRKYFLQITLVTLFILLIGSSYLRFIYNQDYMVTYEGDCNPISESCFIGCEDEDCTSKYYYKNIYKHASILYEQCGADITDCTEAQLCLENELGSCYFKYCEVGTDEGCATIKPSELDDVNTVEMNK